MGIQTPPPSPPPRKVISEKGNSYKRKVLLEMLDYFEKDNQNLNYLNGTLNGFESIRVDDIKSYIRFIIGE